MIEVPHFKLYGSDDSEIQKIIQPQLPLRQWDDLIIDEKKIMLQELIGRGWLNSSSVQALRSVRHLNQAYLRKLPGKQLHNVPAARSPYGNLLEDRDQYKQLHAGFEDFKDIFLKGEPGEMVLVMLSIFASGYIEGFHLNQAEQTEDEESRNKAIESAFKKFDRLASLLNYIFEQFSVNILVTRNGFVPCQEKKIEKEIYEPTLRALSDPKWKSVNAHLTGMFDDFRAQNYPEVITKAHSVLQRFLQILVGEEGRNAKGELGKLFMRAKDAGVISNSRLAEHIISSIQSFIARERATNSTAKPALQQATASDALLVMNVVMVFLQHCLQNTKQMGKQ